MDTKIVSIKEANDRFNVREIFLSYNPEYTYTEKHLNKAILLEGDVTLDNLDEYQFSSQGEILIITGNLQVNEGISLLGDDDGLLAVLVLGNTSAGWLTIGGMDFCIMGNLNLIDYLHAPRPYYEQGTLYVKGSTIVPFVIQADYLPILHLNTDKTKSIYFGPDGLEELGNNVYNPDNIEKFIAWAKKEHIKDITSTDF